MARKRSPASIAEPRKPATAAAQGLSVENATGSGDTILDVDATTGQTMRTNPDGSISMLGSGDADKKPFEDKFEANLADHPDVRALLASISVEVLEGIEQDLQSRTEWDETAVRGLELLGIKLEKASAEIGVEGTISRIKSTGLKEAIIKSWANSRGELLPDGGPVKVRDDKNTEAEELDGAAGAPGLGHNGGPSLDDGAGLAAATAAPPEPGSAPLGGPEMAGLSAGPTAPPAPPGGAPLQPGQMGTTEKRNALAQALENDFNHYLKVIDKPYYPDFSRMLMSRALLGCEFRKVYRDPVLRRPVSRWVRGTNIIVSSEATSLEDALRVTERIPNMTQSQVKRLQKIGHWRDIALVIPNTDTPAMEKKIAESAGVGGGTSHITKDQKHTIYECYCELDMGRLAKDETGKAPGWPLPYRVTIDKDSREVLEIRRNWKKGDALYQKRRRYVKYGHVPSLGFYDWGFVHLIGDPQRGATMVERALIDCGMLASFPGGLMAKTPGTRQRTTQIRPGLGEFQVIDTGNKPIQDFAMTWPYKEPSAVLAAMGEKLEGQMQRVAGQVELPIGEGRIGNTPVGTIMAYIDTVTKVPSAVHKDDHIAQQEEFELLRDLFKEDPGQLVAGRRKPGRQWTAELWAEVEDADLVPAADPNVPSQTHRLMQVNMLVQIGGQPQFAPIADQRAIYQTALRTAGFTNTGEYTLPPTPAGPPPPDPRVVAAEIKAQSEKDKIAAKTVEDQKDHQARMEELAVTSADKGADREAENFRAGLKSHHDTQNHLTGLAAEHVQHKDNLAHSQVELGQKHVQHLNELDAAAAQPEPGADNASGSGSP